MKRRIMKNHNVEAEEATHDLITALRVALRRMLEEADELTSQNREDSKRGILEEANRKKAEAEKNYQNTLKRQKAI